MIRSRSSSSRLRRMFAAVVMAGMLPLLVACPKKHDPVVADAEPPPVVVDSGPAVLAPLDEDAGADADAADAKHATGPYKPSDPLVANIKKCCSALTAQAKANGNPPDIMPAVNTCNAM